MSCFYSLAPNDNQDLCRDSARREWSRVFFRRNSSDLIDGAQHDCYSVEQRPIVVFEEARRWMYASRRSGAEGFSFIPRPANQTQASTKTPKASPPAPASPVQKP